MTFNGDEKLQLSYLLDKISIFFKVRDEMIEFLYKVSEREVNIYFIIEIFNIENSKWDEKYSYEYIKWKGDRGWNYY